MSGRPIQTLTVEAPPRVLTIAILGTYLLTKIAGSLVWTDNLHHLKMLYIFGLVSVHWYLVTWCTEFVPQNGTSVVGFDNLPH